jgi:geranylgeranyl reductase family protein
MNYDYDIIIIGAGPAGSTCALFANRVGLKVLLVDKKTFPRDKICGDAITEKGIRILKELNLFEKLEAAQNSIIDKIGMSSLNGTQIDLELKPKNSNKDGTVFICRREIFDNILFQEAKSCVDTLESFKVETILHKDKFVYGVKGKKSTGETVNITAKVVVGADGFSSIISRELGFYERNPKHFAVATRAYYEDVADVKDSMEIHLVKDIQPGYFWIFPVAKGIVNVGLGILDHDLKKKKLNLREKHEMAIQSDFFKKRFKDAKLIGKIVGSNLPLGSTKRQIHGDGFILIGDAAGLVDPFAGEGIGNAMKSAKIAAFELKEVCSNSDYSKERLNAYTIKTWKQLYGQLRQSYILQKIMLYFPWLVNFLVKKAAKHKEINDLYSKILVGQASIKTFFSLNIIIKLFFK